jgi:hypothetical protein
LRGLVSLDTDHDYVHVLINRISKEKRVNIKYSIINIADFERGFVRFPFDFHKLVNAEVRNPDYLIVQIGENVSRNDIINNGELFEDRYSQLLQKFPNAIKVICIPFWPDIDKQNHIVNIAISNKAFLIDLSHLGNGTDPKNFAKSEKKYKQPGVGEHPGNYGMKNIADTFYALFNVIINKF